MCVTRRKKVRRAGFSPQKPGDLIQMDTVRTAQRLQAAKEDFLKGGLSDKEIGIKIGLSVKQTEKVHNWWISCRRALSPCQGLCQQMGTYSSFNLVRRQTQRSHYRPTA